MWAILGPSGEPAVHSSWKPMSSCLLCFERPLKGTFPTGVLSSDLPLRAFDVEGFLDLHMFAVKLRLKEVLKFLPCFDL